EDERTQGVAVLGIPVQGLGPLVLGLLEGVAVVGGQLEQGVGGSAQVPLGTGKRARLLRQPFAQFGHPPCSSNCTRATSAPVRCRGAPDDGGTRPAPPRRRWR